MPENILPALLALIGLTLLTACGPRNLPEGEECTGHGQCNSGYCNLESNGRGECDDNDFGEDCEEDDDCEERCQITSRSDDDVEGYCTRRCNHVRDCAFESGWSCSSLGPSSPEICRQE